MANRITNGLGRALRVVMRVAVTLAVIGGVGMAVALGRDQLASRADAVAQPDPTPVTPVAIERIAMRDTYSAIRRVSGQVEAQQQTDLAFELAGSVSEILVREGDTVAAGTPIARLDTRLLEAERARLEAQRAALSAQAELARRTAERQASLRDRGFAPDQRVDDTAFALARLTAEIAGIDAALVAVEVNLSNSTLNAPFAGEITVREVDAGAVVSPGRTVAVLIESGAPQFRAGLPPDLADRIEPGARAEVTIDGQPWPATLTRIAPDLDPVTRARLAFFDLPRDAPSARSTGELRIVEQVAADGAWVPVSALRQGPRGTWTLLVVRDGVVAVEAAEILSLDTGQAFVRGTFRNGDLYVPGGVHRVVPGQRVTPVLDEPEAEQIAWER
jgi:RND family efflux transporter MFP subunit